MPDMSSWGPATVVVVGLTMIAAVMGGIIVAFGDQQGADALTFSAYLDHMSKFVIGVGALGIGRGILKGGKPPM